MGITTSRSGYVTVLSLPHFGEHAVPTGKVQDEMAEFILLNCKHGEHKVWLKREEIGQEVGARSPYGGATDIREDTSQETTTAAIQESDCGNASLFSSEESGA